MKTLEDVRAETIGRIVEGIVEAYARGGEDLGDDYAALAADFQSHGIPFTQETLGAFLFAVRAVWEFVPPEINAPMRHFVRMGVAGYHHVSVNA